MSQRDKPRLALNNFTAGVRERSEWSGWPSDIEGKTTRIGASECGQRTSFHRTRAAAHLDEIQGVVANTLNSFRYGAVGFIDWLDLREPLHKLNDELARQLQTTKDNRALDWVFAAFLALPPPTTSRIQLCVE